MAIRFERGHKTTPATPASSNHTDYSRAPPRHVPLPGLCRCQWRHPMRKRQDLVFVSPHDSRRRRPAAFRQVIATHALASVTASGAEPTTATQSVDVSGPQVRQRRRTRHACRPSSPASTASWSLAPPPPRIFSHVSLGRHAPAVLARDSLPPRPTTTTQHPEHNDRDALWRRERTPRQKPHTRRAGAFFVVESPAVRCIGSRLIGSRLIDSRLIGCSVRLQVQP